MHYPSLKRVLKINMTETNSSRAECVPECKEEVAKWGLEEPPPVTLPVLLNHSGTNAGSLLSIGAEHDQLTLQEDFYSTDFSYLNQSVQIFTYLSKNLQ